MMFFLYYNDLVVAGEVGIAIGYNTFDERLLNQMSKLTNAWLEDDETGLWQRWQTAMFYWESF